MANWKCGTLGFAFAAALAGATGAVADSPVGFAAKSEPLVLPLATVSVAPQPLLTLAATVRARFEAPVAFQAAGRIQERLVNAGQAVRRGDLLARLDPRDIDAALAAAQAQQAQARAQRDLAASELARTQALVAKGFAGAQQRDRAEAAFKAAEATLRAVSAELKRALLMRQHTELRAPRDGVVLTWLAEPGQVVAVGQPVVRLAIGPEQDLEVMLPESLAASPPLEGIATAPSGTRYPVRWREQDGGIDPVTRTVRSRYHFTGLPPGEALLGALWQVTFPQRLATGAAAFQVPVTALDERGGGARLWRWQQGGEVEPVAVTVLGYGQNEAIVTGALAAGDRIVAAGSHRLTPGTRVVEAR